MCDQQMLRPACAYAQSDQSLCLSHEYSMSVKLLTEHHLEFLSLKGSYKGPSESTLVKMPHCWKSHVTAHLNIFGGSKLVIYDEHILIRYLSNVSRLFPPASVSSETKSSLGGHVEKSGYEEE